MLFKNYLLGLGKFISLIPFLFISNVSAQVYLDSTASIDTRVNDLLGRMTIEEKAGQMAQINLTEVIDDPSIVTEYFLGSILSGGGAVPPSNTPDGWANVYDQLQEAALNTRLKIPIIYGIDAVHGHNNLKDAVIFPHNIGLGTTRDPELVEEIGRITALEVSATGLDWTFAPCITVPQDERWGRTYEGFGETPDLAELLGSAYVRGFQGDTLSDEKSILACAKHFLGDGGTTDGHDQGNTEIDEETLRRIHLPGYIEAINNGVGSIMATYNRWNGQNVHGSHYLLTTLLKEELGFEGFVVSDWAAIDQLEGDYLSDIKTSINAGIDMVMIPDRYETFIHNLTSLVSTEEVSPERIDDAVKRILRIKFMLGLFERPYSNPNLIDSVGTESHRNTARKSVRESLTLLKKKDKVLPLSKTEETIFVAGSGANDIGMQCGGWTISWQGSTGDITEGTTIFEGIRKYAGSNVFYSRTGESTEVFDKAIVVIGEKPYAEGLGDKSDLTISKSDIELVRQVYSKGKPTIVILLSGRPMIINPIIPYSDAIFAAWLPGTEGDGISQVLFGDYEPYAKLGHSWAKYIDQIPINVGDENYDPLFEYNYGITSLDDSDFGSSPVVYSSMFKPEINSIQISFNKNIDSTSITECEFNLIVEGHSNNFSAIPELNSVDPKSIIVPITIEIAQGQKLSLKFLSGIIKSTDGGILQTFQNEFTYNGMNDILIPFSLPGKIEAEDYFEMFGVQTESTADSGGGLNVGWIDTNDWMSYYVSIDQTGSYSIDYRTAALSQNGIISLMTEENILSSTILPVTNDWQNWETTSTEIEMEKGTYFIKLYASRGGFNINWFSLDLISDVEDEDIKEGFSLKQNYPNPFNSTTTIEFTLPKRSNVTLIIFDVLGNQVSRVIDKIMSAGTYSVKFDGSNVSSGVYFYQLTSGDRVHVKKLILLR